MSTTQWLLGIHVLGAFLFIAGAVLAGILQTSAIFRSRPSEIALLLRLTRVAVVTVAVGALVSLAFGVWLVEEVGFTWGDAWIDWALALWIVSLALGALGGRSARHTRYLAERLVADGDSPSAELRRALSDPVAMSINYASLLAALAVLALMIWRPA